MMTNLDLKSAIEIKKSLPEFGKITAPATQIDWLDSYLSLYNLPKRSAELNLYCGKIMVRQQSIFASAWEPAQSKGTAIIVHGYLDNLGLYGHLINYLIGQNLTVVCFDLPGLGLSDGERASIADFSDYTSVLEAVLELCQQQFTAPFHGIGQSTGGAILLKHLLDHDASSGYPFSTLNLLAPLLHPKGWWLNRHVLPLIAPFKKSLKRRFGLSSHDDAFLAFIRQKDIFQPETMPLPWFLAADKWARQCETCDKNSFPVTIIQGTADTTLDWKYNLNVFKNKFPNMRLQLIMDANHHMANESKHLRNEIFDAIGL